MANIPQPREEEKEEEDADQSDDEEEDKNGTEVAGELTEQGSPIVNEVEEMEANEN